MLIVKTQDRKMRLFQKLFSNKQPATKGPATSAELNRLRDLDVLMNSLLTGGHYVARSEYQTVLESYHELPDWFRVLKDSGTLEVFCNAHNTSSEEVNGILSRYDSFSTLVESQNEQFIKATMISEKEYLDNILKESDPEIILDDDQRRVVLTDEDYCLVVAGAGAGKTTTVAAKVKYLVDKQGVDPKQILVISYTNKAVNELKERIVRDLHIECPIATFHSTGNAILHKQNPERLNIVDPSCLYFVLQDYLRDHVLKRESAVNNLILFFASYFDAPYEGRDLNEFFNHLVKMNYSTIKSELDDFRQEVIDKRSKKAVTIQSEVMRSGQEVEIANFLYLNGIDYEYEPLYKYNIQMSRKPYTPDFKIVQDGKEAYLEHFGITQDGRNSLYSAAQLDAYKRAIRDKIRLHEKHGTKLLYTYSAYDDRRPLIEHLQDQLLKAGFELRPRSREEIIEKIVKTEGNRYIRGLVNLIQRFIHNFKTNGYTLEDFSRLYRSTQNVRTRLFLDICRDCYLEYDRYLKEKGAVDFEDMINESERILREVEEMKQKLDFRYVIVDEYQDISRQRFDLVKALHRVTDAKIVAVGDDWQSIYAFSGSDITLFTKFAEKMGYAKLLKIVSTYRNSQEVIDIAGTFIQKNTEQIQKDLISHKHLKDPVIIYTYDSSRKGRNANRKSGANYELARAIETALGQIVEYNRIEGKPANSSILLLGRFSFDGENLERTGLFQFIRRGSKLKSEKYPKLNITFMTAHSSKGLGYDNVIIVNGRNERYGFPAKVEDDPVLSLVVREDRAIEYAEERRLFYVALTRTKNRVFCIAPEQNPSEFLLELKRDFRNVVLRGDWNEDFTSIPSYRKTCPMCGYPMQYRYKLAYGLRLYICTNEPEVCSFMTNSYEAGKLSIIKCDQCRDGYLIVKLGRDKKSFMLGCTNYNRNGTGCSNTMSVKQFYSQMGIKDEEPAVPLKIPKGIDIKTKHEMRTGADEHIGERDARTIISVPNIKPVMYKDLDLNSALAVILQTLSDISRNKFYGASILTNVLLGSADKKIVSAGLNKVEGFGSMSESTWEDVRYLIEWLVEKGYILKTKGNYPVLHPTYKGAQYGETMTNQQLHALRRGLEKDRLDF